MMSLENIQKGYFDTDIAESQGHYYRSKIDFNTGDITSISNPPKAPSTFNPRPGSQLTLEQQEEYKNTQINDFSPLDSVNNIVNFFGNDVNDIEMVGSEIGGIIETGYTDIKGAAGDVYSDAKAGLGDIYDLGLYFEIGALIIGGILAIGIAKTFANSNVEQVGNAAAKIAPAAAL
jgi:hypothetical protein